MDLNRTPVLIGAGQHTNRIEDPPAAPDPFALLEMVARQALSDAAPRRRLPAITHVWVVNSLSLRHNDPAGELAQRLGVPDALACYSGIGGAVPQWLVNRAAETVTSGGRPVVLIAGAEALATRKRAKRADVGLPWPKADGRAQTWPPVEHDFGVLSAEVDHGLAMPTHMYALIETAVAAAMNRGLEEHLASLGRLMERFNAVAAENPISWFPTPRDAEDLSDPTGDNRWICWPYPKLMNAVMDVDMAAAVLVTDAQTAREAGVASDEVAYVRGWADAKDVWYVSQRPSVADSPAIAECGRTALSMGGADVGDVTAFDLYSCFPSAVEVSMRAVGISSDDDRPLTLTGGLPYHGGPGNNYVTHAVANTLRRARDGTDEIVLVHGNGYYLTKHAVGVYSSQPPPVPPQPDQDVQGRVDVAAAPVAFDAAATGRARVVAYTVPYERDGTPGSGVVLAEMGGTRTLAIADEELTVALVDDIAVGSSIQVTAGEPRNRASQ